MSRVSVSELKARLSHYLREVRRGGEVEILDRGLPVARLSRIGEGSGRQDDERRDRLIRAGVLRQATGAAEAILDRPLLSISVSLRVALEEERADRL